MAHGWDERAQMNMLNHMMAMQNNMNVMAMNLMAQQRAFGNSGGANDGDGTSSGQGNPASPFLARRAAMRRSRILKYRASRSNSWNERHDAAVQRPADGDEPERRPGSVGANRLGEPAGRSACPRHLGE